jgi:DNA-binding transcriptional regulator YiaG
MPNLAIALKEEIRRLAKKEVKAQTGKTKQAVAVYRREIAKLKRVVQEQVKRLARLEIQRKPAAEQVAAEEPLEGVRFSPRSVRAQRKRLRLSAADYGKLVGVSGLTIYNWEHGKAQPRKAQFTGLVAVRGIGRREALAKLDQLGAQKAQEKAGKKARRKVTR